MADSQISLKFGILNPAAWSGIGSHDPFPLQQHPCYALAVQSAGAAPLEVSIYNGDSLIGRAILMQRRFFGILRLTTLFRGPVWINPDTSPDLKIAVYKAFRKVYPARRWNFLALMPEASNSPESHALMRHAGYRQVTTGFSTIWVDLRSSEEALRGQLKGKWRNQLVSAEKNGLSISIGGKKPHHYSWLLDEETKQRQRRKYHGLPVGMVPTFAHVANDKNGGGILSVTAIKDKTRIAGALFLLHGNSATYHIGHATETGRTHNAQNLVLWQALLALKERGINYLDMGGLNTADLEGIARFKLGLGADPITLVGTYL